MQAKGLSQPGLTVLALNLNVLEFSKIIKNSLVSLSYALLNFVLIFLECSRIIGISVGLGQTSLQPFTKMKFNTRVITVLTGRVVKLEIQIRISKIFQDFLEFSRIFRSIQIDSDKIDNGAFSPFLYIYLIRTFFLSKLRLP